jgi:ABC-type transport system substrate-binding protein
MSRAVRFGVMLTGILMLALPLLGSGAAQAQKRGGSLTVGLELDIAGFDPLKVGVFDTSANMAAALLFDTLTSLDDKGEAQPKLALSWSHAEDYKTWTFKLRPGVKFHDGTVFDAQAVKFNIDRQKDPKNKCRCAFYIAFVKEVQAPDPLTAIFVLTDPSVNLPKIMAFASSNNVVQSPAAMQGRGDDYNPIPWGADPLSSSPGPRATAWSWRRTPTTGTRAGPTLIAWCCGRCRTPRPALPASRPGRAILSGMMNSTATIS